MPAKSSWGGFVSQITAGILAAAAVTAASYIWRLPQACSPRVVLAGYAASFLGLTLGAEWVLRKAVRRSYRQYRRLTLLPYFLQLLIWGLFFAFPCIYNPYDWAWSQPDASLAFPAPVTLGWICVGSGLMVAAVALARLGLRRACGLATGGLEMAGLYKASRNPQLVGGALVVLGYGLVRPSGYALGWACLYAVMAHEMVLTEEEHLETVHGEAYAQYCRRVPRYLGIPTGNGQQGSSS